MKDLDSSRIRTRQDFSEFVSALRQELNNSERNWENDTIDSFLEAISAYTLDVEGYYKNKNIDLDANNPSWRVFADILRGASIYE
ncbi:hypothetical protein KKF34_17130 [Myxococcota bacterium]|nr:hypothetical protein [Myxococcota bacterium]MBU1381829.1 hypothetical protein [Myxococcota bacterium]MBU1498604.1 hypothetical protein [Myxococcota bacterium]